MRSSQFRARLQVTFQNSIQLCLCNAFPTAAVSLNPSVFKDSVGQVTPALRTFSGELGKPYFFSALATFPPSDQNVWNALYRREGRALGEADLSVTAKDCFMWVQNDSGTRTPSWAPHGVAYVGGYHTADLLPIVLPTLLKHLPVCCEAEGGSTTAGRTKKPSYMKGNTIQLEMEKRGCSVVGRDLVKVSTPLYADDKELPDRVEALLLFADPSVGYTELNGASSSGRRTVLRGAFGYSLPLLATSLPRVLIDTCRTLRQSHLDASGTPVASSALWISHIAHALGFQSDALLPLCSNESCRDGTLVQLIAQHVLEVLDGADAALTKQMNHNFFLPEEHFSFSADAQCLVNKKGHLLEDFKRRSAS